MTKFIVGLNAKLEPVTLNLTMANRHGLIAGATGTGKTVTLQHLAEQFSEAGVSVFTADIKGDLVGIAMTGEETPKIKQRLTDLQINNYSPHSNPVVLWDIYAKSGHPLRTTVSEMGPLLLGRMLDLNDTQQGVLNVAFSYADDEGLLLLDLKDLRSLLDWIAKNSSALQTKYGNISSATVGAIQRGLLSMQEAGGEIFFGEPAFKIDSLFQKDVTGKGVINILDATKLVTDARLYSTFLLWLLSTLFETMPEVGDQDKPKLVFFFDEAHLIFNSAPKPLLEKIEQLVRLIRSKGIGIYFISQNPLDIPENVLGQLGNRVQHALRAFTPKDQKAVKSAAQTFRQNPEFNTEQEISNLSVGEALVSVLDETGTPSVVDKIKILPPASRIGAITIIERESLIKKSPFYGVYEEPIDRESAFEVLNNKHAIAEETSERDNQPKVSRPVGRPRQSTAEVIINSTVRTFGTQVGRQIVRGILGSIFSKR